MPTLTTVTTHERRSGLESAQPCCPGWESVIQVRSSLLRACLCRKMLRHRSSDFPHVR